MTDSVRAMCFLPGHKMTLAYDNRVKTFDGRGLSNILPFIEKKKDITGYSVGDVVVGKAAALLFVKANIYSVYAKVISRPAIQVFRKYGIPTRYTILVDNIKDESGTGICPLEVALADCLDYEEGYKIIKETLARLRADAEKKKEAAAENK